MPPSPVDDYELRRSNAGSGAVVRDAVRAGCSQEKTAYEDRGAERRPLARGHEGMLGASRRRV